MLQKSKEIQTRKERRKNGMDRTEERTRNINRLGIGVKYPRKKKRWRAKKVNRP